MVRLFKRKSSVQQITSNLLGQDFSDLELMGWTVYQKYEDGVVEIQLAFTRKENNPNRVASRVEQDIWGEQVEG